MITDNNLALTPLEQALNRYMSEASVQNWLRENAQAYRELMAFYRCALMEVETKFRVLNEDFSLLHDSNPIESIHARLKEPESIVEKMVRNHYPLTVESIENNLNDVAGVRVICSFVSDVYLLADALLKQDDVELIARKDYIKKPKANGYRSLHLIISIPIFLHDHKRLMRTEVQIRTMSMNGWASSEHKVRYKKDNVILSPRVQEELLKCAELGAEIDRRLEWIREHSLEPIPTDGDE